MSSLDAMATAIAREELRSTPSRLSRVDQIDVLRGLSIIFVVIHHITLRISLQKTAFAQHLPKWVISDLRWNGYNGVVVFFVISGFLITSNCYRRWGALEFVNLRQFYAMRFARIVPCLVALLAVLSVLHSLHLPHYTVRVVMLPRALVAALTFHVNWLEASRGYLPASWDVLWSLCNEEIFYLFFPLLCLLTRSRARLVALLLAFVLIQPISRVRTTNEIWSDYAYLSCMGVIAIGCLAAMASQRFTVSSSARLPLQITGVAMMALITLYRGTFLRHSINRLGLDVSILAIGTALILIACAQHPKRGSLASLPLRWFGRNSYEIYLTHMFVIFSLLPVMVAFDSAGRWVPLTFGSMLLACALLGELVARFFSEPLNRKLRAAFEERTHMS